MTGLRAQIDGILSVSPESPAIEFEGRWISFAQLASGRRALDSILAQAGLGADARVAVALRNRPEFVVSILELIASGRCLVTLNPLFADERIAADIESVASPAVVASPRDWKRPGFEAAARGVGALGITIELDAQGSIGCAVRMPANPALRKRRDAPDTAIEMLTSGTTSAPKRIPLPRRNFEAAMADWGKFEKGREDGAPRLRSGTQVWHMPFSHIAGIGGMLNIVLSGRKFVLLERFTVESFHDAVKRHKPKVANGPPTVVRMLLDAKLPREDFASLVTFRCGSAPLDPGLADEFTRYFGIPCLVNYGATEYAGGAAGWTMDDHRKFGTVKRGSVGRLNDGFEGRAVDPESGAPLSPGEVGLLELKAPHLGDGRSWMRTTDLAIVDAERFLFIKGRADNAIIRGGYKVAPDDVVRALEVHPAVREAAVVGLPDARLGQVPVAALLLKPGCPQPTPDELSAFLRKSLTPYQVPVRFAILDDLPRTASMKVDQSALRSRLSA
jgi:acyl-CoA synthetase (AMP-forming)/AMP-acid ligase II